MMRKIGFLMVALLAVALLVPAPAKAAFPERDITLIVPWAAGGGTDTLARTLVKNGKKYFGVNINVQNVTGGTGVIGMNQVARAKPDGYTVGLDHVQPQHLPAAGPVGAVLPGLRPHRSAQPQHRGAHGEGRLPIQDPEGLGGVRQGESGRGDGRPLGTGRCLASGGGGHRPQINGLKFTFVPFDGAAPTRTALVGGHITVCSSGMDEVLQFYQTKQVRILAANSPTRHPAFPDVPTMAEAGYPIENPIFDWRGLAAAKGTPPEVLKVLREGFQKAAEDPEYIALMDKLALPRTYLESDKFQEFLIGMEKSLEPTLDLVGLLKKK